MAELAWLIALAALIVAIVALRRGAALDRRLRALDARLSVPIAMPVQATAVVAAPPAAETKPAEPGAPRSAAWAGAEAAPPRPPPAPTSGIGDVEQALASRWFVWLGGIAIAIGGLLFVKYAFDSGLFPPVARCAAGVAFGALLVAASEWLRRRDAARGYIPAALAAAGLVIAFGSIYAAHALYQLLDPTTAFVGMAVVALAALALALRQGPLIAGLGLIGAYGAPLLVPSSDPDPLGLFPYLLVILATTLALLRARTWWWAGYAAISGALGWALLWIWGGVFEAADTLPIGLFALALGGLGTFAISGRAILAEGTGDLARPRGMAPPLTIALAAIVAAMLILAVLVGETYHWKIALALLVVGAAGVCALAAAKPGLDVLAPAAGLFTAVVLFDWRDAAFFELAMDERGFWVSVAGPDQQRFLRWMLGLGAGFTVAGLALFGLRPRPWVWAGLASGSVLAFGGGAWARVPDALSETGWIATALIAAALLGAGLWRGRARLDEAPVDLALGVLMAGAVASIAFALDRALDRVWLTLALAALVPALALLRRPLPIALIGSIATSVAALVALRLFTAHELWSAQGGLALGDHWVIYGYGLPALAFLWASRLFGAGRAAVALEGTALGLAIALVSLELRVLIGGGVLREEPGLLEAAAHALAWLGAAYGLMHRRGAFSSFIALWGARLLIAAAVAVIVAGSLVALNPVVTEAPVAGGVAFNALLLAYLAPALLVALIALKLETIGWRRLRLGAGGLALILAFAYLTLQTKRVFQGPALDFDPISDGENYAYSIVWLAFSLALFVAGIRFAQAYLRYAGLSVLALVSLKVFLWDLSDLGGLYRIASFIGLGLCLVGIGWLYTRFVQPARV